MIGSIIRWWINKKARNIAFKNLMVGMHMGMMLPPPLQIKSHYQLHLENKLNDAEKKLTDIIGRNEDKIESI